MKTNKEYSILASGNAPSLYPTRVLYGLLWYDNDSAIEIPMKLPHKGVWGESVSTALPLNDSYPIPFKLSILWISLTEKVIYEYESQLPTEKIINIWESGLSCNNDYSHIVVGMAPFGQIAVWVYSINKSNLVVWDKGAAISISITNIPPLIMGVTKDRYCSSYIESDKIVKQNLERNGLPLCDLFDNYMKQFMYRYQVATEKWKDGGDKVKWEKYKEGETTVEFDYIEEALYDGTHDKLHNGELMKYHEAGKPKKLKVQMHKGKTEWSTYLWFEDEKIREVFNRFYGAHPDTKTDFIIHIDAEKKKYELALYRYGLKEPQIIPDDTYQLLVFKNKFENYRSENYNQEPGAWIW